MKGVCVDEAYRDSQHVTVHAPLTPETEDSINAVCLTTDTKDSIDKEPLTKMPKGTTPINAARPDGVHKARDAHEVLQRENRLPLPPRCASAWRHGPEGLTLLARTVNDFAEHRTLPCRTASLR